MDWDCRHFCGITEVKACLWTYQWRSLMTISEHNASNQINTDCLHCLHLSLSIFCLSFLFMNLNFHSFFPRPLIFLFFFLSYSVPYLWTFLFVSKFIYFLLSLHRPPGLTGSPVISDISLIRLSPHAAPGTGESPFSPPHPYVSPHMEHYLRSVHGSPTLSMISAARGLSPAEGKIHPTYQHKI